MIVNDVHHFFTPPPSAIVVTSREALKPLGLKLALVFFDRTSLVVIETGKEIVSRPIVD